MCKVKFFSVFNLVCYFIVYFINIVYLKYICFINSLILYF